VSAVQFRPSAPPEGNSVEGLALYGQPLFFLENHRLCLFVIAERPPVWILGKDLPVDKFRLLP
jgi:hypothetical protein